jgi:hypothetical protein
VGDLPSAPYPAGTPVGFSPRPDDLPGNNIFEARITPKSNRDWDYLARELGIDRNTLRENLHRCKRIGRVPPKGNVEVDDETGELFYRDEYIGNLVEGCR